MASNPETMNQSTSKQSIGVAFTVLSGVGIAIMPTTARLAYESGSDTMTVAFSRGIVATTLLFLILLILKEKITLPREHLRSSLVAGIGGVMFVYSIYGAILYINISLVILIIYLYPMALALYEHIRGTTRLSVKQWTFALLACAGLSFIVGVELDNIDLLGVILALIGMIACVIITLANHKVTESIGSLRSNLYMSLWSAIVFCIILLLFGEFLKPNSVIGWSSLGANGVGYCIAWVAFFSGARILGATRASMITLIDPPMSALISWIIFNEMLTTYQWIGFVVVMLSLVAFEMQSRGQKT
ncbi:MAG: EamA family transporter [Gammaproteobacteria bacterium]|nr:EamA family transporter [Gammaproteobacteria bacterium]